MSVTVIGGGAAGCLAAILLARGGESVTLLEKNARIGRKIYITGKGRCNLTADYPPQEFLGKVVRGEKFLRSAVYGFSPEDTKEFFNAAGVELITERGGRVFPAKYDRRHDVSVVVSHKFSERFDISGTWVFSTGNAATLNMQTYDPLPGFVDDNGEIGYESDVPYIAQRNNFRYPAYHRLDLGVNFHKKKKRGTRTWNISVYNAYNSMNPFLIYPDTDPQGRPVLTKLTLFPIIPSVSYTFKW